MAVLIKLGIILGFLLWISWKILKYCSKLGGRIGKLADELLHAGREIRGLVGKAFFWSLVVFGVFVLIMKLKRWYWE